MTAFFTPRYKSLHFASANYEVAGVVAIVWHYATLISPLMIIIIIVLMMVMVMMIVGETRERSSRQKTWRLWTVTEKRSFASWPNQQVTDSDYFRVATKLTDSPASVLWDLVMFNILLGTSVCVLWCGYLDSRRSSLSWIKSGGRSLQFCKEGITSYCLVCIVEMGKTSV